MGPWAGQQPGSFPRRHRGGLNHKITVHPLMRTPSLGLLGCFIYLKTFFLLYMYQDSTVHCAMPSSPTPHLVVAEKNTLEFSLFPVRENRECGTRVTKGECALESSEPSPELRSRFDKDVAGRTDRSPRRCCPLHLVGGPAVLRAGVELGVGAG